MAMERGIRRVVAACTEACSRMTCLMAKAKDGILLAVYPLMVNGSEEDRVDMECRTERNLPNDPFM